MNCHQEAKANFVGLKHSVPVLTLSLHPSVRTSLTGQMQPPFFFLLTFIEPQGTHMVSINRPPPSFQAPYMEHYLRGPIARIAGSPVAKRGGRGGPGDREPEGVDSASVDSDASTVAAGRGGGGARWSPRGRGGSSPDPEDDEEEEEVPGPGRNPGASLYTRRRLPLGEEEEEEADEEEEEEEGRVGQS